MALKAFSVGMFMRSVSSGNDCPPGSVNMLFAFFMTRHCWWLSMDEEVMSVQSPMSTERQEAPQQSPRRQRHHLLRWESYRI